VYVSCLWRIPSCSSTIESAVPLIHALVHRIQNSADSLNSIRELVRQQDRFSLLMLSWISPRLSVHLDLIFLVFNIWSRSPNIVRFDPDLKNWFRFIEEIKCFCILIKCFCVWGFVFSVHNLKNHLNIIWFIWL